MKNKVMNCLIKVNEKCEIADAPSGSEDIIADTNVDFVDDVDVDERIPCTFPFRFKGILYYACTNITLDSVSSGLGSAESPIHLCAIEKDLDFNPTRMGFCNTNFRCPIQCKSCAL